MLVIQISCATKKLGKFEVFWVAQIMRGHRLGVMREKGPEILVEKETHSDIPILLSLKLHSLHIADSHYCTAEINTAL